MQALREQLAGKLAEQAALQAKLIEVKAHVNHLTRAINQRVRQDGEKEETSSSESDDDGKPMALEDVAHAPVAPVLLPVPDPVPVVAPVLLPVPVVAPVLLPVPVVAPVLLPVPVLALVPVLDPVPGAAGGRGRKRLRPALCCHRCWNLENHKEGGKHSRDIYCKGLTQAP